MLCPDLPFPPNAGHRVDFWRRINALKEIGASLFIAVRVPHDASDEDVALTREKLLPLVDRMYFFRPDSGHFSALKSASEVFLGVPWLVARRTPNTKDFLALHDELSAWRADRILLEGPWCGELAKKLSAEFNLPVFYRSHNVEYQYMRAQAGLAAEFKKKLSIYWGCIGLKAYEKNIIAHAFRVLDISADDARFWQDCGVSNIVWLPPVVNNQVSCNQNKGETSSDVDVLFLGNLSTPNNVTGVLWLVNSIWPQVRRIHPEAELIIAGSSPVEAVIDACQKAEGVVLLRDVPDAAALYNQAKLLVNPIKFGSGVQIKAVEMLMTSSPIVSTSQGVRGLPEDVRECFNIADTDTEFVNAIISARDNPLVSLDARRKALNYFSSSALATALSM